MAKKKHKTFMLVLDDDDPDKELEFNVEFQLSLTAQQRYKAMSKLVKANFAILRRRGYQEHPAIVVRS